MIRGSVMARSRLPRLVCSCHHSRLCVQEISLRCGYFCEEYNACCDERIRNISAPVASVRACSHGIGRDAPGAAKDQLIYSLPYARPMAIRASGWSSLGAGCQVGRWVGRRVDHWVGLQGGSPGRAARAGRWRPTWEHTHTHTQTNKQRT